MSKGLDAGKAFLAGVLAKLSPEDRARGTEALATIQALGGGIILTAVGDGTLAQDEFSRLTNELTGKKTELDTRAQELEEQAAEQTRLATAQAEWWGTNKPRLDTFAQLIKDGVIDDKGAVKAKPGGSPTVATGITQDQLNEALINERAAVLGFERDRSILQKRHFDTFGEWLDTAALLTHPQVGTVGLVGAYDIVYKDRLAKHVTDTATAAEAKIRADERAKVQGEMAAMPYPMSPGPSSGSPLDALTAKTDTVVDAATAHYQRLQQEHAAAGAK